MEKSNSGGDIADHTFAAALALRLSARQAALRRAAEWVNRHFPERRASILATADDVLQGYITIAGSSGKPMDAGTPPAWKEIRTMDSHYGSDLNRMLHWDVLCKAYWLTGECRYAERMVLEALDWIVQCPRPPLPVTTADRLSHFYSPNAIAVPWHCLNIGIRLFSSWRMMIEVLAGTSLLDSGTLLTLAHSMREQAEAILAVSPVLFPDAYHNHHLMEMLGVLAYGCTFPELPDAPPWGRQAAAAIERCALAQLAMEGAQVEGCPGYHNGSIGWFCQARYYAAECGVPLSAAAEERIRRGFEYAIYATRPSGTDVPWGDSPAGCGFIHSATWALFAFDDPDPLRQAARVASAESLRQACADSLWNATDARRVETLLAFAGSDRGPVPDKWPLLHWQHQIKQVSLRTAWQGDALGLFFAAYSPVHYGFHGHIDPCGFDFTAYGQPLLVDGGVCAYYESERRRRTKSATGHNMLTINFREPFDYCNSFAYGPQQEGGIDWVQSDGRLLAVQGWHRNYAPALHRRALALLDNRLLVVLDALTDLFWLSSVQLYYQFPFASVQPLAAGAGVVGGEADGVRVVVVPDPSMGTITPPYRLHPETDAPVITTVRFDETSQRTERVFATVVVPLRPGETLPVIQTGHCETTADGYTFVFTVDSVSFRLLWAADRVSVDTASA